MRFVELQGRVYNTAHIVSFSTIRPQGASQQLVFDIKTSSGDTIVITDSDPKLLQVIHNKLLTATGVIESL